MKIFDEMLKSIRSGKKVNTVIVIVLTLILLMTIWIGNCSAATQFVETDDVTQLEALITECADNMETSHTMADCARKLHYPETDYIITTAKEEWHINDVHKRKYTEKLNIATNLRTLKKLNEVVLSNATDKATLESLIATAETNKETAHNIAEFFRNQGYDENSVGIISAKNAWALNNEHQNTYKERLSNIPVNSVITNKVYSSSYFRKMGVIYWNGYKYTYYSQKVLPGGGLKIPGRHVNSDGYVCDADGYICLANSAPLGTVFPTPFGAKGKVYDRGTSGNHLDVYCNF